MRVLKICSMRSIKREKVHWEISSFSKVLDYMHLVYLGMMKRLIRLWVENGSKKILSGAIWILCSDLSSQSSWRSFLNHLPHHFVEDITKLHGKFIYNFHNHFHLRVDIAKFGHLDQFSVFPLGNCYNKY
ncbi:hypothetical protein J437_LFUL017516 [Ladona fulva]|uniref:Uncharacterized protein n=1 Tax=Ladona fulva TaxID=123851 RepID=A0A8K0KMV7_LADFU|nr:hypothetical protein J437_LFUL017516 [Ladona fulva]